MTLDLLVVTRVSDCVTAQGTEQDENYFGILAFSFLPCFHTHPAQQKLFSCKYSFNFTCYATLGSLWEICFQRWETCFNCADEVLNVSISFLLTSGDYVLGNGSTSTWPTRPMGHLYNDWFCSLACWYWCSSWNTQLLSHTERYKPNQSVVFTLLSEICDQKNLSELNLWRCSLAPNLEAEGNNCRVIVWYLLYKLIWE